MKQPLAGKGPVALGVAVLLAALASWAYHSFFFSPFEPVRIGVVDAEQTASRHVVPIALPDVSNLRGQHAVLALQLRNGGPEPKRIALLREGFQGNRIALPPDAEVRWDILVSPELMQVLGAAGAAARTLELTGDADVWSVTSGEIRNYRVHVGGPLSAAVLPTSTGGYRVWLSTSAFFLLAAALFAPVGFYAATTVVRLPAIVRRSPATMMRGWKRHEVTFERGAAVLGLVAIAIAQPVFEVVSNSPEFFPARSTDPGTLVATVLVICWGIPLGLLAIERAIRAAVPRGATIFHGAVLTVLMAALVMPWFRRGGMITFPWDAIISVFIGVSGAVAYTRIRGTRQFLTALAPAALIVPALFLLAPSVKQNFVQAKSEAAVQSVERTPPIVLIIFDELPTNSLLDATGAIDAGRFPNIGAFARGAYWFRNASTVAYSTSDAVPAILSGRNVPSEAAIPTLRHWPVNLFTALAPYYRIFASIRFQRLCPPSACEQNAALADTIHQRHLAQLGYVDRLIGDLVARLRSTGAYDDALVIITADHGASHREGQRRRNPRASQQNLSDILQVPLFVKLPGQQDGEVVDRIVETVDIFPTILDVLGAKASYRLDGRSLIDSGDPGRRSFFLRSRTNARPRRLGDLIADRAASLERKERRFGRGDLQGLYAPPSARYLLGTNLSGAALKPAADVQVTVDNLSQYESVVRDRDPLPIYVSGVLETRRADPLNVAVAVNGTVAAIARSYRARGGHMFGTLIPETLLRDGKNAVTATVVDGLPVTDP